ncbi:MAG TPA: malto-oligosyltrehalose synthase [Actinomycetota bacterium]|nr:malto-oligosyltrehalose synthase [Actinomycetota bacterium]
MTHLRATYRLQLRPEFGFEDAAAVVSYLAELGVSHVYTSPLLQAAPGSTHGYDVVDYGWVSEELGGSAGLAGLEGAVAGSGMGMVIDIVPNHMATGPENAWWWDVLENGPASRYACWFDIDWHGPETRLHNKVLLPILESHYGRVLEAGKISVVRTGAVFQVHCPGHPLPVTPESLDLLLLLAAITSGSGELESIAAALGRLPPGTATDPEAVRERSRDAEVLLGSLARLLDDRPAVAAAVDAALALLNADPDTLDVFLERQNYRLAYWRTAGRDLPYRRFFDINTLVGLNMEREEVFAATHALIGRWLDEGRLDGVRVDHPDGLRDPEGYLGRLREKAPAGWIVVEKILEQTPEGEEALRASWPADGTTGYEFLNRVNGLFVDPAGEPALSDLYLEFSGEVRDFGEVALASKHDAMSSVLASDINRLTELMVQVCERHRRYRDYTRHELHEALREFLACLPVYRTYVDADRDRLAPEDRSVVLAAAERARARRSDLDPELFEFLTAVLTLVLRGPQETELVMRLQQISAAVMAKGVEDTAFYRYHRLVSLNEVGGSPEHFGGDVASFHRACRRAAERWPRAMLTLATHDTKRGPDVRARLNVLSEIPDAWAGAVIEWMKHNDRHRSPQGAAVWPDHNLEYLLYQTLVGAWPLSGDRALAYLQKAAKEAKEHTSWTDPNPEYDAGLEHFVREVLRDEWFLRELEAFVGQVRGPGWVNGLAQMLVLLTAPGVPDLYQGTELWDLSLVDPDNRRPVDYPLRVRMLQRLESVPAGGLWAEVESGLPKLAVVRAALDVRRRFPAAFEGSYEPLASEGEAASHVVAFCRGGEVVTAVPRLVMGVLGGRDGWGLRPGPAWRTALILPPGRFREAISGRVFEGGAALGDLWAHLPVALLTRES